MNKDLFINVGHSNRLAVFACSGSLAQLEVYKLKRQIELQIEQGVKHVVLDIANVNQVDSAGIGALVSAHQTLKREGGALLVVRDPKSPVAEAIVKASLDKLIVCAESQREARDYMHTKFGVGVLPGSGSPLTMLDGQNPPRSEPVENVALQIAMLTSRVDELERKLSKIQAASPNS